MKQKLAIAYMCAWLTLLAIPPLEAQSPNPMALVGSWELGFDPGLPEPSFPGLATFTSELSVVETDAKEVTLPRTAVPPVVYGTPGHGTWGSLLPNRVFILFESLIVNPNATLYAKRTVRITAELDPSGNKFVGSYIVEVVDPAGQVIDKGSGTVTGQKIPPLIVP